MGLCNKRNRGKGIVLLGIYILSGVGSEIMQRIAAPMIGGVVSSAILSLLLIPIFYMMYEKRKLKSKKEKANDDSFQ